MAKTTALAGVLALVAGMATAQTYESYGTSGDWNVLVNPERGGCLIERTNAEGAQVIIGFDAKRDIGYLAAYVLAPNDLGSGETRAISFDLDGDRFSGDATGYKREGYEGGYAWFNNPNFAADLANKQTLTLTPEGGEPVAIDLTGTKAAMGMMTECQSGL